MCMIQVNIRRGISHNMLAIYGLTGHVFRCYNPAMGKKPMTVVEMASMGGRARAAKYSHEEISEFAKDAGRPAKLDGRARRRLRQLLATGRSQAQCALELGVSTRTIGRAVARMRAAV
jgi:hypothetical protein